LLFFFSLVSCFFFLFFFSFHNSIALFSCELCR
jgi:hypothetical protein